MIAITSNNTSASTIWNLLQENKFMPPAQFEEAMIGGNQ